MPRYYTVQSLDLPGGVPDVPDIGDLKHRAGSSVPAGWLLCDGLAISRATYAALFGVIGTTWGAGNGTTTFNLPDLRGRSLVGTGTGPGLTARVLGATGGEETHLLTLPETPVHNHALTDPGHGHNVYVDNTGPIAGNGSVQGSQGGFTLANLVAATDNDVTGITLADAGGGGAHNTMHPFACTTPVIYAGV